MSGVSFPKDKPSECEITSTYSSTVPTYNGSVSDLYQSTLQWLVSGLVFLSLVYLAI